LEDEKTDEFAEYFNSQVVPKTIITTSVAETGVKQKKKKKRNKGSKFYKHLSIIIMNNKQ